MKRHFLPILMTGFLTCLLPLGSFAADPPKVGDKVADFSLKTLDGQQVTLSALTAKENVVLVMLRGWPGYQCPICERQVQDFIASADKFAEAKARVLFIYPGPADGLKAHAQEFAEWKDKHWPKDFLYVMDPDYTVVNAYNLRWDAPRETAYPSTFVIDKKGVIQFAKVSKSHGGRAASADVIEAAKKLSE
jgi:thioredoxin-dependent peroxiredoxin